MAGLIFITVNFFQDGSVHIQALYPADGILPGSSSKLRHLVINLASVPGGQLVNSPTAQSLKRWWLFYEDPNLHNDNYIFWLYSTTDK